MARSGSSFDALVAADGRLTARQARKGKVVRLAFDAGDNDSLNIVFLSDEEKNDAGG